MRIIGEEKYQYDNLSIPGGGYVTGFLYHDNKEDLLYMRTDIGGTYRYNSSDDSWVSLTNYVAMDDIRETFPIAVAVDPVNTNRLYVMSGIYHQPNGLLSISDNQGNTFYKIDVPFMVHGNLNGRGTGYRLVVDPNNTDTLYYASQEDGLWCSLDAGLNWRRLSSIKENHLTFVGILHSGAIVVGSAGVTTRRTPLLRGKGLYISYDHGVTFEELWQPEDGEVSGIKLAGLVPQRYQADDMYLYVTFSIMGYNAYALENGYSCDGGSVVGGKVVRYRINDNGELENPTDITPYIISYRYNNSPHNLLEMNLSSHIDANNILDFGFSGVATSRKVPGLVVVSTICKEDGDCIYRSYDYGKTWECILHGLNIGIMDFYASYMKPQFNGGHNLIHWLTDIKINPFNENVLLFNTGTGVFRTTNLLAQVVTFSDCCKGLEETVHLNLYSPTKGNVKVIDILGDLGGFAFTDFDKSPDNSFADTEGNRYITCLNADFAENNPECVVVTPRGNWTGKTKGGLILSHDECKTFERINMPFGLDDEIDELLHRIENPNVNSGWVAISPSGKKIAWSIANGNELPVSTVIISQDEGRKFSKANIYDKEGKLISNRSSSSDEQLSRRDKCHFKVFSDRVDDDIFYGFGDKGRFYVSVDGGLSFFEQELGQEFPKIELGLVDCANKTEIRGESGKQGVFYMALGTSGLWKLYYDKLSQKSEVIRLGSDSDEVYRIGLGVIEEGADYCSNNKALYVAARISGVYGFYRSIDDANTFVRINDVNQMFGEINSIEGDSQVYGRFYIGTGSRGLIYGEPADN